MWFYSHKLSKIVVINNLTFVSLTVYPFFGMWVYYQTFSAKIFLMAVFLFLILIMIDMVKDLLTKNADKIFGYATVPNVFGNSVSKIILSVLTVVLMMISMLIVRREGIHNIMNLYFAVGLFVLVFALYLLLGKQKKHNFFVLNILRVWVFFGILAMLLDGLINRF
nr:UbiA family prenyltransferase [Kaistella sp. 97-N-M2]